MKPQEIAIYREIQRNAEMAVKALDTVSDKVWDEEMSQQISRQSYEYSQLRGKAVKALLDAKEEPYRANHLTDLAQKAGIHYNTLFNTSTGHLAELMIRKSNEGMLALEKVLRHNQDVGEKPVSLAKQFLDCEEQNISMLKDYL